MDLADGVLWPLAPGPDRAAHAAELYLHFALFVMRVAEAPPVTEPAFAATTVALAQRRYDARGARPETLGAPPRRCVLADPLGRLSGLRMA
jgi:hypothetical protein